MGVTDKVKGAAAAVQDKVTGEKQHAATTAKVQTLLPHQPVGVVCLCKLVELTARLLLLMYTFLKLISKHSDLQTDKEAHKASEEAHGGATKGHLSQAQGHAKDAAKQAVGAGDAKKEQAKAGHKVGL